VFHYDGILGPSRSYQAALTAKLASGAYIFFRISNHEGSMKINGVLAGRKLVQEGSWLFALARFAKPVRTNVWTKHFSATTAKIRGEGIEPLEELVC
jgi:hypothetical protein